MSETSSDKPLSARYWRYLAAFTLTALSTCLGNLLDGVIVGQMVSAQGVAAVGVSRPLVQAYFTLHTLLGAGAGMLIGLFLGKGDRRGANVVFRKAVFALAAVAAAFTLVGVVAPEASTKIMCSDAALLPNAVEYLKWIYWGAAVYFAFFALSTFVAVDGEPGLVTAAVVVDNAVNVAASWALIKFCDMGVAGASVGTLIGHGLAVAVLLGHWRKDGALGGRAQPSISDVPGAPEGMASGEQPATGIAAIVSQGAPLAIASICLTVFLYTSNLIVMDTKGEGGMFVYSVCLNLLVVYNLFLSGACQTMQSLGAIEKGKGEAGFKFVIRTTYVYLFISSVAVCVFTWIAPELITAMFGGGKNPALAKETDAALRIFAPAFVMFCFIYAHMIVAKLRGENRFAVVLSFALSLTPIPVMWAIARYAPAALWWSYPVAYVIELTGIGLFRWMKGAGE